MEIQNQNSFKFLYLLDKLLEKSVNRQYENNLSNERYKPVYRLHGSSKATYFLEMINFLDSSSPIVKSSLLHLLSEIKNNQSTYLDNNNNIRRPLLDALKRIGEDVEDFRKRINEDDEEFNLWINSLERKDNPIKTAEDIKIVNTQYDNRYFCDDSVFEELEFKEKGLKEVKCITTNLHWAVKQHIELIDQNLYYATFNYLAIRSIREETLNYFLSETQRKVEESDNARLNSSKITIKKLNRVNYQLTPNENMYSGVLPFPLYNDIVIYKGEKFQFNSITHHDTLVVLGAHPDKGKLPGISMIVTDPEIADSIEAWFNYVWENYSTRIHPK